MSRNYDTILLMIISGFQILFHLRTYLNKVKMKHTLHPKSIKIDAYEEKICICHSAML